MIEKAIAIVLTAWTLAWYPDGEHPESTEARDARVSRVVRSTFEEARSVESAVAALVVMHEESGGWAIEVHRGDFRGDGGRANCLGQLHANRHFPREKWLKLHGTGDRETRNCVRETARRLYRYHRWCGTWSRAFGAYATGQGCVDIELGRARARRFAGLLWRLRTEA